MRFRGKLTHQSVKEYALEKNENSVNQSRWGFILSMEREKFSSRLGFILISAGCAIGLGNVWRFPYIVGAYGGAAFVLIYLAFLLILGLPIVVMEFAVGRASKRSAALSFNMLEPKGTKWHLTRYAAMAGNYMLMMFYTTVAGWMIYYFIKMLRGDFTGLDSDAVAGEFTNMLGNPALMTGFMIFVVVLCFGICAQGLVAGVERITKVMMVCLLFLMMALDAVREGVGPRFPIEIRISGDDLTDVGLGLEDCVKVAKMVEDKVDLINVSCGNQEDPTLISRNHPSAFFKRGVNVYLAAEIKKNVSKPVACVGSLNDPAQMEEIIATGQADIVEIGRALLADPYLAKKALEGNAEDITPCLRCYE